MDKNQFFLVVDEKNRGKRLDIFLKEKFSNLSRNFIQKLILKGNVTINEIKEKSSHILKEGDKVKVIIPTEQKISILPERLPVDVVWEDEFILVVNKPPMMVVHPNFPEQRGTLVNFLLFHSPSLSQIGGPLRPGIVHRLDKDTSGLMLVAKDDTVHLALSMQFKKREVKKRYLALVRGIPRSREGVIDVRIGRNPVKGIKMMENGKQARDAVTKYRILKSWDRWSLLELFPLTGRTHQIRVHLRTLNCFLLGDRLYGGKMGKDFPLPVKRAMLHAKFLGFFHPKRKEWMEFEVNLPRDMQEIIDYLERTYESKG